MFSKIIGGVRNAVSNTLERAKNVLPPKPQLPNPFGKDGFDRPRIDLPKLPKINLPDIKPPVIGLPRIDLPKINLPKIDPKDLKAPIIGLPKIDLPSLGEIKDGVGDFIEDVKDGVGDFFGDLKDKVIRGGVEALFKAIEALPGDVGDAELNKIMDIAGVKAEPRGLTDAERVELEKIYGDSIDYDKVQVRVGDIGLFNVDDRPLVLGNTVLVPDGRLKGGEIRPDDLVHEAVHLWQFQHGGLDYIKQSFQDQGTEGQGAYDISDELKNQTPWSELRTEQQAVLIETMLEQGYFDQPEGSRSFRVDGVDYSAYAAEVLEQLRAGEGAPGDR